MPFAGCLPRSQPFQILPDNGAHRSLPSLRLLDLLPVAYTSPSFGRTVYGIDQHINDGNVRRRYLIDLVDVLRDILDFYLQPLDFVFRLRNRLASFLAHIGVFVYQPLVCRFLLLPALKLDSHFLHLLLTPAADLRYLPLNL